MIRPAQNDDNKKIEYSIKKNRWGRRVKIVVRADGAVEVYAPVKIGEGAIAGFVAKHKMWIAKIQAKIKRNIENLPPLKDHFSREAFIREVNEHIYGWSEKIGVRPAKTGVRKMRSRWGSCSKEGNISINLLLGHLPGELLEYVVVHELCHLVHHNHSKLFWSLVAAHLPDHKARKRQLHRYGYLLSSPSPLTGRG